MNEMTNQDSAIEQNNLDGGQVEGGEPTNEPTPNNDVQPTNDVTPEPEAQPTYPEYVEVNGEKIPFNEVTNGYMRQSDYTRKTQEIAKQRQEMQDALELVDYLKENPHVAQRLVEAQQSTGQATPQQGNNPGVVDKFNPAMKEIEEIKNELFMDKLDREINTLKTKYPDFNEVEVLNRASELGVNDLEFVYNAMRGQNLDNVVEQRVKEALSQAQAQQQKQNEVVSKTLISGGDQSNNNSHGLSDIEMKMADKLGMSYEDYSKWK